MCVYLLVIFASEKQNFGGSFNFENSIFGKGHRDQTRLFLWVLLENEKKPIPDPLRLRCTLSLIFGPTDDHLPEMDGDPSNLIFDLWMTCSHGHKQKLNKKERHYFSGFYQTALIQ